MLREPVSALAGVIEVETIDDDGSCLFRAVNPRARPKITIRNCEEYIQNTVTDQGVSSAELAEIKLSDHFPLPQGPTATQLRVIVTKMKGGTAPGPDQITVDLLKQCPPEFFQADGTLF